LLSVLRSIWLEDDLVGSKHFAINATNEVV
jgi:hypothetical protein